LKYKAFKGNFGLLFSFNISHCNTGLAIQSKKPLFKIKKWFVRISQEQILKYYIKNVSELCE
jgi:hypothetical protein